MVNQRTSTHDPKKPNFLLIVILSAIALIIFLVIAVFLVGEKGKKLLPNLHHDAHPTSSIAPAVSQAIEG